MKKITITALLFSVTSSLAASPLNPAIKPLAAQMLANSIKEAISCRPISISDGDTLTCLTTDRRQVKVRLNKIDAPEKSQPFGQKAKQALSSLIWGKLIIVFEEGKDRYGRTIGTVVLDGQNINKTMVSIGYAWAYRQYLTPNDRAEYLQLESQARSEKRGLWADPKPIYPSDFRQQNRR